MPQTQDRAAEGAPTSKLSGDPKAVEKVVKGVLDDIIAETEKQVRFTRGYAELMRKTCCPTATDDEAKLFLHYCKQNNADALNKEAWFQIRWSKKKGNDGRDLVDPRTNKI